jgi:hypothetical protein
MADHSGDGSTPVNSKSTFISVSISSGALPNAFVGDLVRSSKTVRAGK